MIALRLGVYHFNMLPPLSIAKLAKMPAGNYFLLQICSASEIIWASGNPKASAIALQTFKLGLRRERSIRPTCVGWMSALSASNSCDMPFVARRFLNTAANATVISTFGIHAILP